MIRPQAILALAAFYLPTTAHGHSFLPSYEDFQSAAKNPHGLSFAHLPAPFQAANLRENVTILTTLSDVRAFNAEHDHDVRVERVGAQFAVIRHNTTTHVASLGGEALEYARRRLDGGGDGGDGGDGGIVGPYRNASQGVQDTYPGCLPTICFAVWGCDWAYCHLCLAFWCA